MAQKSNYNKLAQFRSDERARAVRGNPALLSGLTPTQIAELFPDYFRRGLPDVGGFREAISKETAKKQGEAAKQQALWQQSVDARLDQRGGMLARMRERYSQGGPDVSMEGGGSGNVKGSFSAAQYVKILKQAGFSHKDATLMAAVGMQESNGNIRAANDKTPSRERSYGLFQVNINAHPFDSAEMRYAGVNSVEDLYDPVKNAKVAYYLYHKTSTGIKHWGGFTDGGYKRYLGTAQKAAAGIENTTPSTDDQKKGATPPQQQAGGATTPGAPAGDVTAQAGQRQRTEGAKFNVVSGYIVPNDKSLYDTRNAQQCATLGKAFNPSIGRSSSWTIVDGDIKAGQVVATKQYNNSGADRVGAGYHTGVALTAPNEKGDFLLLEQYNGSGGAKTKWVNKNSYPIGHTGQTTSFGLISSGGKVHDEVSQEALSYGQNIASPEHKSVIGTNSGTPGQGGDAAPGVNGQVDYMPNDMGGVGLGPGGEQSASLIQPQATMQNLMGQGGPMGMMMGMMSGMGGQSASPLGLITSAMGFIMPLIGSFAGERLSGEGMGDGSNRRKRGGSRSGGSRSGGSRSGGSVTTIDPEIRKATSELHKANSDLGKQHLIKAMNEAGITDPQVRNIYAANAKGETNYEVKPETSYSGTNNSRIKDKFSVTRKLTDSQLNALKANDEDFFNYVYGGKLGNKEQGEGYKYRGRGQIQITGKENYETYGRLAGFGNKLVENPDMLNDPEVAAKVSVAFLKDKQENYPGKTVFDRITRGVNTNKETVATKKSLLGGIAKSDEVGMSVTTDIASAQERFNTAKTRLAALKNPEATQVAATEPTVETGTVAPAPAAPTQMAQASAAPSFGDTMRSYAQSYAEGARGVRKEIGRYAASMGFGSQTPSAQPYVNPYTPGSTDISRQPKPGGAGITPQAMTAAGISPIPDRSITRSFAANRDLSASVIPANAIGPVPPAAPGVIPQTNVPATPATPPAVTPMKGAMMQAPGPAPTTAALQSNQMTAIAAAVAQQPAQSQQQMPRMDQVSTVLNHAQTIRDMQKPADNPSVHRAFARAFGQEESTRQVGGNFSYGNTG